jgi:hypothetical protein
MVDGNEALWRGPYERQAAAEKAGFKLAAEIDHLDDEAIRRIAEAARTIKRSPVEGQTVVRIYLFY